MLALHIQFKCGFNVYKSLNAVIIIINTTFYMFAKWDCWKLRVNFYYKSKKPKRKIMTLGFGNLSAKRSFLSSGVNAFKSNGICKE